MKKQNPQVPSRRAHGDHTQKAQTTVILLLVLQIFQNCESVTSRPKHGALFLAPALFPGLCVCPLCLLEVQGGR